VEKQRVVQREQGTVNREQEKPRMNHYNQDRGYVPATKTKHGIPEKPVAAAICRHGISSAFGERWRQIAATRS
jgi:hypothetical protein